MRRHFVEHYELLNENKQVIEKLVKYFNNEPQDDVSLQKGVFLYGPVGTGKTTLMRAFSKFKHETRFNFISCRELQKQFATNGWKSLQKYGRDSYFKENLRADSKPVVYCFDDFGSEGRAKYFGNDANVMEEVLQDRYEEFSRTGMITHITSNLGKNGDLIEEIYGVRVRSRIREMFNVIELNTKDFRK